MGMLGIFSSCGHEKVTITVLTEFRNDSVYIPEEEEMSKPKPEPTVYEVASGDEIDGIRILSANEKRVRVKMYTKFRSSFKVKDTFTIRRGESVSMSEDGLLDATHNIIITFPE